MSIGSESLGARGVSMDMETSWAAQGLASSITNLNSMARFQQKQLQEKEQKLLQLYDQQQQRAYQVVQRGSAGSTGSNHGSSVSQHTVTRSTTTTHSTATSQGGGKVRQMFDERRQTTVKGIDRSYPLEPLDNKPRKLTASSNDNVTPKSNDGTVNRQTITVRRVARADVNSNVNGGKPLVSYSEEISREDFHGDDNEFGNENDDDDGRRYANGNRSNVNRNEVSIEEIIDDDTIGRNRMMAKIHLMNFDKSMKYRVNNDLESEQFPDDLMLDVPDKLPKRAPVRKISQAEARLERFKNANTRRSNVARAATTTTTTTTSTTKKRTEPMFGPTGTNSRESVTRTRTVETTKTRRSPEPAQRPVQSPSPSQKSVRRVSKDSEPTKPKSKRPKFARTNTDRPETLKARPVEPVRTANARERYISQTVESTDGRSKIERTTVDTRRSVGLAARKTVRESASTVSKEVASRVQTDFSHSKFARTDSPEIESRPRKPVHFETIVIERTDRRDDSPEVIRKNIVTSVKTKSKPVDFVKKTSRSTELASRKTTRSESPSVTNGTSKRDFQTADGRLNERTQKLFHEKRAEPACRVLRITGTRLDSNVERKGSVDKAERTKETSDIVRSAELVREAMQSQSPSEKIKSTKSDRNYMKSTESSSGNVTENIRKATARRSSPETVSKTPRYTVERVNSDVVRQTPGETRSKKKIDRFVESSDNRAVRRTKSPEQVRGTPRFDPSQSKGVGSWNDTEETGIDRSIERVQRTGNKASPIATRKTSIDTITVSDHKFVEIDSRQTDFGKRMPIKEIQRSGSSLRSYSPVYSPVSSENVKLAESDRKIRKPTGEDVIVQRKIYAGRSKSEGRKSPSVHRLCRDTIYREASSLERPRTHSEHVKNLKARSPDRKEDFTESKSIEDSLKRSRVSGANSERLKKTKSDRRVSPKRTIDATDNSRETRKDFKVTVSQVETRGEHRKSPDFEHEKDKILRSAELVRKMIRKHDLDSFEGRDSKKSGRKCLESLEQEVGSTEVEQEIKSVERPVSPHGSPKPADSAESSPKTSVSPEINTERPEITIIDQCIERVRESCTHENDMKSKNVASPKQSKSLSASAKDKSTDHARVARTMNGPEKLTHDHPTFLVRKPVRKRTSVLESNIYETNRVPEKKHAGWETRKTKQFIEPAKKLSQNEMSESRKESVALKKVAKNAKHALPTSKVSGLIGVTRTSSERMEPEETLRSAELVRKAMQSQSSDLETDVTITDRSTESVRETTRARKREPSLVPNAGKRLKSVKKSSTYTIKSKHPITTPQKPKIVAPKRRICSKLHQHVDTNFERAKTIRSTRTGTVNERKSVTQERPASKNKASKGETSAIFNFKRPSTANRKPATAGRFSKFQKSGRSDSPDGEPMKSYTGRAGTRDALRSIELVRKVIRDQSPKLRHGSSKRVDMNRETRERAEPSNVLSDELEILETEKPEEHVHKIVKKQRAEATIAKERESRTVPVRTTSKCKNTVKDKERNISQQTVHRLCKKLVSQTESNVDRSKLVRVHSKRHHTDMIPKKPDFGQTKSKDLTTKPCVPKQFETISNEQSIEPRSRDLRAESPTKIISKIPIVRTKSKLKRPDSTKVLLSTTLVQIAVRNKSKESVREIEPKQRESISTNHDVEPSDKTSIERNLEKQEQKTVENSVKREEISRGKKPMLNSHEPHKFIRQVVQKVSRVGRPVNRKDPVSLKIDVKSPRRKESNKSINESAKGKEPAKSKIQTPEVIFQNTASCTDFSEPRETENICLKRTNVDESLQLADLSPRVARTNSESAELPRRGNASTDSIESALRRFDSIGIETEHQETTKVDASDTSKQNHTSDSGSSPMETPTKDIEPLKDRSKPEETAIATSIRKTVQTKSSEPVVRVVSKKSLSRERVDRKYSAAGKAVKANRESLIQKKRPLPTPRLCTKSKVQTKSSKSSEPVQVQITRKKLMKTRDSIELARRPVEIQKPLCRRKLFEDLNVEIELGRPKSVDFDFKVQKIEETQRPVKFEGKVDWNENQRTTSKISKIPVAHEESNLKYSQPVKPLRSIKVIRESIRKGSPDHSGQVKTNLVNIKTPKSDSTQKPSQSTSPINVKSKSPVRFVFTPVRNKEGTIREVIKDSMVRQESKLEKEPQAAKIDLKSRKTPSTRQPITIGRRQQSRGSDGTKIQKTKPGNRPKSTETVSACSVTTKTTNHEQRESVKVTRSTELSKRATVQRKTVKPLPRASKSSDSSPESKRSVESKTKRRPKSVAARRSTQNQHISESSNHAESHVVRRKSVEIDRDYSIVKKIVRSFDDRRRQIENQDSKSAVKRSKETVSVRSHFEEESCTEEVKSDYEETRRICKHSTESRSESPDSLEADSGYRTAANACRYSTADSTQSPDLHDQSSPNTRRIYKSTESSDDSLTACYAYGRRATRIEASDKLERNSDRDQSPGSVESRSGSPDSLEANYNRRKIARNERSSPTDLSRGLDRGQSPEYSRKTAKIAVESCSESQDSLETGPSYTKSVEFSKYSTELTLSPDPNEKQKPPRNIINIDSKCSRPKQTLIKTSTPPLRVTKSPSPDPALGKSSESRTRTPAASVRRNVFASPSKSPEVATRGSAGIKSPEPRFAKRSPTTATKSQNVANSSDVVDASNLQNDSQLQESKFESESTKKGENLAIDLDAPAGESKVNGLESPKKALPRKQSAEKLVTSPKQRSPTTPPHPRPISSLSTGSSAGSVRGQAYVGGKGKMATKPKSPAHGVAASKTLSAKSGSGVGPNDALTACKICGRRFAQERVTLHEQICAKTGQKKRKQFDTVMFRVKGTDLESFVKKGLSKKTMESKKKKPEVKSNWRRKHEDFINAIRSAKQVQAHLAAGGKLSDLPPPPASDTSDYVQCPHCGRKFNQGAAERHIPKCQTMLHNKPNPRAPPKPKR